MYHKTAITRKVSSVPMRYLNQEKLLVGKMLDYGCGRGKDADHFGMAKYDPNGHPDRKVLNEKYDTVTCNYVLNVIKSEKERDEVIRTIKNLLTKSGKGYISVRRDIKEDTPTQYVVELDLPSIRKTSTYEIYEVTL